MVKKILIGLVVALCLFAVGYNAYQSEKQATTGKRNVYALFSLTGFAGRIGQQQKATLELWKAAHPDASFDVHVIDSETMQIKALSALRQALLNEKNPIVITSNSLVSYNSLPVIEEKKGFEFMVCTFDKEGVKNPHFLRMSDRNVDSTSHIARYLTDVQRVVLIYSNEEFGKNSVHGLIQLLKQQSAKQIDRIEIEPTQLDIRIEALKALDKKPEAIVVLGFPTLGIINLIKELKRHGYEGDIVMGVGLADPSVHTQLEGFLDKVIFPDKDMIFDKEPNASMLKKIGQIVKGRPYHVPIEIWDTLDLIDWTIKNNKPFTQETYAQLKKWKGLAGDIEFLDDGNVIYQFHLATFKDGKIVPMEE